MKLILVDDEQKFIAMLAKRLSLRGVSADFATTGNDAIQMVRENSDYDAAVLDLKMPGISGHALKNKLLEIKPDLKCIFVTGHGALDQPETGNHGEDHLYLSKPLNIDTLIETIQQIIEKG